MHHGGPLRVLHGDAMTDKEMVQLSIEAKKAALRLNRVLRNLAQHGARVELKVDELSTFSGETTYSVGVEVYRNVLLSEKGE